MLTDLSIKEFLEKTASGTPTPGGGSVAALNGAVAAGLVEMGANLSANRENVSLSSGDIEKIVDDVKALRKRLMDSVDEDARAYDGVMAALRMPKSTEDEKASRRTAIRHAFKQAADVPMNVAVMSADVMGMAFEVAEKGNPNAVSDSAVAILTAKSAVISALCNVKINLSAIDDVEFRETMRRRADRLEADIRKKDESALLKEYF